MMNRLAQSSMLLMAAAELNIPTKEVAPGVRMPVVSVGTWTSGTKAEDKNVSAIVGNWLDLGGRGIDTAFIYFDQKDVAEVLATKSVPREDLFITSKFPTCLGAEATKLFLEYDLNRLNTDYIDLMLIHAPGLPGPLDFCDSTWKVMEDFVVQGKLKSIGVSNWGPNQFKALSYNIRPAVNQVQYSVFTRDEDTETYCNENNITIEAWSPLGDPARTGKSVFTDPTVKAIAAKHKVTAAQVALRWIVQKGYTLTFLSSSKEHQADSGNLFGFKLEDDEMASLDALKTAEEADTIIV